jgi:hypothetical protein
VLVDTAALGVAIGLPPSPNEGDTVELADPTGSWSYGVGIATLDLSHIYVNGVSNGTSYYDTTNGDHLLLFYHSNNWYLLKL